MARLFFLVAAAFKAWMFFDAVKRDAESRWFWLIPFVPGGAVIYFFVVKIKDREVRDLGRKMMEQLKSPTSVDELQRNYARTPSTKNRILLGQGLFDADRFDEALVLFEEVLKATPLDRDGLYGAGLCQLELQRPPLAVAPLRELVENHPGYRDYAAWPELAEALWFSDQRPDCISLLQDLVRMRPRLNHQLLLAQYLQRAGMRRDAELLLVEALDEEQHQPRHVQKLNRGVMRDAKRLLSELRAPAA